MRQRPRTRETQQRKVVFEAVRASSGHPTADSIFESVRARLPKISLGTVYRNLAVLKSEGLVREVFGPDRRARYEANPAPHGHFICKECGEIWDVGGMPNVNWRALKDLVGCQVTEHRVEFLGLCPVCLHKRRH